LIYLKKMTLAELCKCSTEKYGNKNAFDIYRKGQVYNRLSFREFGVRARQIAALLGSLGIGNGDRVMLLAENRPEWPAAYFGINLAGAVSVPVLAEFSVEQIGNIARHAETAALCITSRTEAKALPALPAPDVPVIYLDRIEGGTIPVTIHNSSKFLPLRIPAFEDLPEIAEDSCASIIYTSGTTGRSKAVMLSNRNLLFCAKASRSLMKIYSRDRLLSIIPLAHSYECTLGLLTSVMSGASTSYLDKTPSPAVLIPALQILRPTAVLSVPLFIEKIYRNRILPELKASRLYRFPPTRFLAVRVAGWKLLSALGGAIRFFGIGGAPLAEDVERFLRTVQFPYAPGYGLTEAAPLVAGSAAYKFPYRSTGSVLKGVEVRIVPLVQDKTTDAAEGGKSAPTRRKETNAACRINDGISAEGEIQVRGPNIMLGYYKDEELTREVFTQDGWLKTGDLGCLDRKGRLYIHGRLKALILGPSGENIYPEEIESLLNTSSLIEDALVYPGEKGELIALVVLSEKAKTMLAATAENLRELKAKVNERLAGFSRISRIEVQDEPFEKTPTQKIKRFLYPHKQ
jgi:long-chain acyl-CoA synthetase